jgi:hypothetical protein
MKDTSGKKSKNFSGGLHLLKRTDLKHHKILNYITGREPFYTLQ